MSSELFEKFSAKIQQACDCITLLQMELEEKREHINALQKEHSELKVGRNELEKENYLLKEKFVKWEQFLQEWCNTIDKIDKIKELD